MLPQTSRTACLLIRRTDRLTERLTPRSSPAILAPVSLPLLPLRRPSSARRLHPALSTLLQSPSRAASFPTSCRFGRLPRNAKGSDGDSRGKSSREQTLLVASKSTVPPLRARALTPNLLVRSLHAPSRRGPTKLLPTLFCPSPAVDIFTGT